MWQWKAFKKEEVLSPDGLLAYERGIILINPHLMDALEEFRDFVGQPLVVNHGKHLHRGYRSYRENFKVDGEMFSQHMLGLAVDLSCPGMDIRDLHLRAKDFIHWTGLGYYPSRGFIHCDIRRPVEGYRMEWNG